MKVLTINFDKHRLVNAHIASRNLSLKFLHWGVPICTSILRYQNFFATELNAFHWLFRGISFCLLYIFHIWDYGIYVLENHLLYLQWRQVLLLASISPVCKTPKTSEAYRESDHIVIGLLQFQGRKVKKQIPLLHESWSESLQEGVLVPALPTQISHASDVCTERKDLTDVSHLCVYASEI